jgi:hypothetical protein
MHDGHRPFRAPLRGNLLCSRHAVYTCRKDLYQAGLAGAPGPPSGLDVVCKARNIKVSCRTARACLLRRSMDGSPQVVFTFARCPRRVRPLACAPPAPNAVVAVLTLCHPWDENGSRSSDSELAKRAPTGNSAVLNVAYHPSGRFRPSRQLEGPRPSLGYWPLVIPLSEEPEIVL